MRLSQQQRRFLPTSLVALLLTCTLTTASPYPKDDLRDFGYGYLMERNCDSYCGADNQYCCSAGQQCYTTAGIAGCSGATVVGGGYDYHTTTITETRTYTSTWSSFVPGATEGAGVGVGGSDCIPRPNSGEIACGSICCTNQQYCAYRGQCMPNKGAGTWSVGTTVAVVTTQYSAPYRVTSGSTIVETTGTAASQTAEPTSTDEAGAVTTTSNQLSPGAIAGIVIGTILGVALLLLLCFCCIARGLWHAFAAVLGLGPKKDRRKTERVEVIEEHYRRGSSVHGRPVHRTWFGGAGGRPTTVASRKEEKKSSGGGWLAAAGGATLLLLGLRRGDKKKENRKPPRSDWSSSYYTDDFTASSPSSASSDRRTRRSRQSRGTRASVSRVSRSRPRRSP